MKRGWAGSRGWGVSGHCRDQRSLVEDQTPPSPNPESAHLLRGGGKAAAFHVPGPWGNPPFTPLVLS